MAPVVFSERTGEADDVRPTYLSVFLLAIQLPWQIESSLQSFLRSTKIPHLPMYYDCTREKIFVECFPTEVWYTRIVPP